MKQESFGIQILSKFYLFLMVLYALPIFVFSTRLKIFGQTLSILFSHSINVLFVIFLFFLYRFIKQQKKIGLWLASIFHTVFLINSFLIFINRVPLLKIEGTVQLIEPVFIDPILIINMVLNVIIIGYLTYKRDLFVQ